MALIFMTLTGLIIAVGERGAKSGTAMRSEVAIGPASGLETAEWSHPRNYGRVIRWLPR